MRFLLVDVSLGLKVIQQRYFKIKVLVVVENGFFMRGQMHWKGLM